MNRIPRGGPVVRAGRSPARGDHAPSARDHPRRGRPRHRVDQVEDAHLRLRGNIASFNPAKNVVSLLFHRGAEIPGEPPASKATASSSAPCASPTSTSSRPGRPTSSPGASGRRTGRDAPEEPRLEPSARGAQAASAAALRGRRIPRRSRSVGIHSGGKSALPSISQTARPPVSTTGWGRTTCRSSSSPARRATARRQRRSRRSWRSSASAS